MKFRRVNFCVVALVLALVPAMAMAGTDFDDYKVNETTGELTLPTITAGYFVAGDMFPPATTAMIDGAFAAEGRMIVAMGTELMIQRTYGSSEWDVVATVSAADTMDPCFVRPSPDGSKIALGLGYGKDLLVFDTSLLSISSPPNLSTHASVTHFETVTYYDGDWADNRYLLIDGGSWPAPTACDPELNPECDGVCEEPYADDPDCIFTGGVGSVDTQAANPATHEGVAVTQHDGASADVHVDADGNVITGIGWHATRTGEIRIVPAGTWSKSSPNSIAFDSLNLLAEHVLSVAYLGEDAEGNLHVGGGDAYGTAADAEIGYAAIIEGSVVDDVAAGNTTTLVDGDDLSDNATYKFLQDDPCDDDSATGIVANKWSRCVGVIWNPTSLGACHAGSNYDYDNWGPGVEPVMTYHCPGSASDDDGDGVPNVLDNAYLTPNPNQDDTDGDGYGDVADADYDNDNDVDYQDYVDFRTQYGSAGPQSDFDADGDVDYQDYVNFRNKYGSSGPWY